MKEPSNPTPCGWTVPSFCVWVLSSGALLRPEGRSRNGGHKHAILCLPRPSGEVSNGVRRRGSSEICARLKDPIRLRLAPNPPSPQGRGRSAVHGDRRGAVLRPERRSRNGGHEDAVVCFLSCASPAPGGGGGPPKADRRGSCHALVTQDPLRLGDSAPPPPGAGEAQGTHAGMQQAQEHARHRRRKKEPSNPCPKGWTVPSCLVRCRVTQSLAASSRLRGSRRRVGLRA